MNSDPISVRATHTPLPPSPARGEVTDRVCGTIPSKTPARHLPLDGGGWEGVQSGTIHPTLTANDNFAPKRNNEEQSHG
jgi:hypothetical protein